MIIENVEDPKVDYSLFKSEFRQDGISGFMRLRNEAEFLAQSIESWLPLLDELIIVYNNCQDNTGEIAEQYACLYPDKIKVYHYLPIVYPQGSEKYHLLEPDDKHSLVNYYNFSLNKTTKKWAIKIDGDLILDQAKVEQLLKHYNELKKYKKNCFLPISGVNLVDNQAQLFVPSSSKYCGVHGDLCLFRVDSDTIFKKGERVEYLDLSKRHKLNNIFAYYHMKFIKNDFGIGNYDFKSNPNSTYYAKTWVAILMMRFVPSDKILKSVGLNTVKLKDFNLNYNRSYKKEAMRYLAATGGKLSFILFSEEFIAYLKNAFKDTIKNFLLRLELNKR